MVSLVYLGNRGQRENLACQEPVGTKEREECLAQLDFLGSLA